MERSPYILEKHNKDFFKEISEIECRIEETNDLHDEYFKELDTKEILNQDFENYKNAHTLDESIIDKILINKQIKRILEEQEDYLDTEELNRLQTKLEVTIMEKSFMRINL